MMKRKALIAILAPVLLAACSAPSNLHQVDDKLWRSGQPTRSDFQALQKEGIGEVLCLRNWHSDREIAGKLRQHRVRIEAGDIRDEDMVAALKIIVASDRPVLVHCLHGSDRTGVVVAMYRMVVQRWPREKAIAEFTEPQYGYHASVFPNIRRYLETVDVEKIRRKVFTSPSLRSGNHGAP